MSKTQQLQIRVSTEQKAMIQSRAMQAGEDVSKWVLRQLLPPVQDQFQTLVGNLASDQPRSYVLAELNDFLDTLPSTQFDRAIEMPPSVRLDDFSANYLAAMIEYGCALRCRRSPDWLDDIKPLDKPWFASPIIGLRLHLLTQSPPPFRRRNLFVDSTVGDRV